MQSLDSGFPMILALLFVIAAGAAVWLWLKAARLERTLDTWRERLAETTTKLSVLDAEKTALGERRERLEGDLAEVRGSLERTLNSTAEERNRLTSELAALDARTREEKKASDEKLTLLNDAKKEMSAQFEALAVEVMRRHGEDFKKSAHEQLGGIVSPLKADIGKFQSEIRIAHQGALAERAALKEQLGTLTQRSEAVSKEAENLTKALRGDTKMQGAWGEAILEKLLESSGLEEGREYRTQVSVRSEEGRMLRPDVVVSLPGGRDLVVDSKVSLTAYEQAVNAEEPNAYAEALTRHVLSLRNHIKGLSGKEYAAITSGSADYVIMFVPIEGALSEALRAAPDLTEYALNLQVMIATPTTLMMALRTVKNVWDVERRHSNAEAIAKRAGAIYDKVVGFAEDMEKVGKQLDSARDSHSAALNKLTEGKGNVIRQVEMLKVLGAKTNKSMPAMLGVEPDNEQ